MKPGKLYFCEGVKVNPGPLDVLIIILKQVAARMGDIWITSGNDGNHAPNSFHKYDRAIDMRSKGRTFSKLRDLLEMIWHLCNAFDLLNKKGTPYKIRIRVELDRDKSKHYYWQPGQPFPVPSKTDLWENRHIHIEVIS